MATYNLFLNASQADTAITNAYRLFDSKGLTGQNMLLYGGNIENHGTLSTRTFRATGNGLNSSYIENLTGGIRVQGVSQIPSITNGIAITGGTYLDYVYGGLRVNGATNITGTFTNVGSTIHSGPVSINGTTRVTGLLNVTGNTRVIGNVDIDGNDVNINAGSFELSSSDISILGSTSIEGSLNVIGDIFISGVPISAGGSNTYIFESGSVFTGSTGQGGGGVIQTVNLGLIPANQGPTIVGTTRGNYSVDLQLNRNSTAQVAAGDYSVLIGGNRNKAIGLGAASIGGSGNWAEGQSSATVGGSGNWTVGAYSNIFGGRRNYISNEGINSTILGGALNSATAAGSVVLGGYKNQAHKLYSVALGTKAKSYNQTELVQGSFYGQRGWMLGAYSHSESSAFLWGDYNPAAANSGLFLPSGASFIKFRVCKTDTGFSSFDEDEFSVVAINTGSDLVFDTQNSSSGYRIRFSEREYFDNTKLLTIEPTGFINLTGFVSTISADIIYPSAIGFEFPTRPSDPIYTPPAGGGVTTTTTAAPPTTTAAPTTTAIPGFPTTTAAPTTSSAPTTTVAPGEPGGGGGNPGGGSDPDEEPPPGGGMGGGGSGASLGDEGTTTRRPPLTGSSRLFFSPIDGGDPFDPTYVHITPSECLPFLSGEWENLVTVNYVTISLSDTAAPNDLWFVEVFYRGIRYFNGTMKNGDSRPVIINATHEYEPGATSPPITANAWLTNVGNLTAIPVTFQVPEQCEKITVTCELAHIYAEEAGIYDLYTFTSIQNLNQEPVPLTVPDNENVFNNAGAVLSCWPLEQTTTTTTTTTTSTTPMPDYTCQQENANYNTSECIAGQEVIMVYVPVGGDPPYANAGNTLYCYNCPDLETFTCEDVTTFTAYSEQNSYSNRGLFNFTAPLGFDNAGQSIPCYMDVVWSCESAGYYSEQNESGTRIEQEVVVNPGYTNAGEEITCYVEYS
jgi:hypothetical protein